MDEARKAELREKVHWDPTLSYTMQKLMSLGPNELYRRYHGDREYLNINEEFRKLLDSKDAKGKYNYLYVSALGGRDVGGNTSFILDRIVSQLLEQGNINLKNITSDLNSILSEYPAIVVAAKDYIPPIPYIQEVCNGFLSGLVFNALQGKSWTYSKPNNISFD